MNFMSSYVGSHFHFVFPLPFPRNLLAPFHLENVFAYFILDAIGGNKDLMAVVLPDYQRIGGYN